MIPFKVFTEKRLSNPLRKNMISQMGNPNFNDPKFKEQYMDYVRNFDYNDIDEPELKPIKVKYEGLRRNLPPRAEQYLSSAIDEFLKTFLRPKTGNLPLIYEQEGVKVFLDAVNVEGNYEPGSYNHRMVRSGVNQMLSYVRDILPNRKPKIIITDLGKNDYTKLGAEESPGSVGMQTNKTMFIDWRAADNPEVYIHEYAHYVADLIPEQSTKLLIKAYSDMLDIYFRMSKTKKLDSSMIDDKLRNKISKKLNFPEYGLRNPDELFAIIIEFWKRFPNNALTYKFKSLVKRVLTRI